MKGSYNNLNFDIFKSLICALGRQSILFSIQLLIRLLFETSIVKQQNIRQNESKIAMKCCKIQTIVGTFKFLIRVFGIHILIIKIFFWLFQTTCNWANMLDFANLMPRAMKGKSSDAHPWLLEIGAKKVPLMTSLRIILSNKKSKQPFV